MKWAGANASCCDSVSRRECSLPSAVRRVPMKGDKKVIQHLNKVLKNELTAVNQYFLHARMWKNWGFEKMANHEYESSIEEMKHADKLIERILLIEGLTNLQDLNKSGIGEDLVEGMRCDLTVESNGSTELSAGRALCKGAPE